MLPKGDGADMKFLDVINGANSELFFFSNCKTGQENGRSLDVTMEKKKLKKKRLSTTTVYKQNRPGKD